MGRPIQMVKVYGIQDRRSTAKAKAKAKLPSIARISIDGKQRSKSFRTRAEADRYPPTSSARGARYRCPRGRTVDGVRLLDCCQSAVWGSSRR